MPPIDPFTGMAVSRRPPPPAKIPADFKPSPSKPFRMLQPGVHTSGGGARQLACITPDRG